MSNEQSIRDELAKIAVPLPLGHQFLRLGSSGADAILASPVIRRIQAEAWESGRKAGNRHGGSYAINPYRKEDR